MTYTKQPITQEMKSFLDDFSAVLKKHEATFEVDVEYESVSFYIKNENVDIRSEDDVETVKVSYQLKDSRMAV